jgi:hypothetical protein
LWPSVLAHVIFKSSTVVRHTEVPEHSVRYTLQCIILGARLGPPTRFVKPSKMLIWTEYERRLVSEDHSSAVRTLFLAAVSLPGSHASFDVDGEQWHLLGCYTMWAL